MWMRILQFLSRWPVILFSFILMNVVGFGFIYVQQAVDGELLDMIWHAEDANARLLEMTTSQKSKHYWATAILDSVYPVAYGGFFIGLTARLTKLKNVKLIWPAICAVIFDFIENVVQLLALSGRPDFLIIKNFITPLKFSSVVLAILVILILLIVAGYRKIAKSK